jgi:PAS domain-containing protein
VDLGAERVSEVAGALTPSGASLSGPGVSHELIGERTRRWGFEVVEDPSPTASLVIDGLLEVFAHPAFALDHDGVVLLWNKPLADLTGVAPGVALGSRLCDATGASTQDCVHLLERAFGGEYLVGERLLLGGHHPVRARLRCCGPGHRPRRHGRRQR